MQRERRSFAKAPSCKMCSPRAAQGGRLFRVFVHPTYNLQYGHPSKSSKAIIIVKDCQVATENLQEVERVVRTDFAKTWVGNLPKYALFEGSQHCLYIQETSWIRTNISNSKDSDFKDKFEGNLSTSLRTN